MVLIVGKVVFVLVLLWNLKLVNIVFRNQWKQGVFERFLRFEWLKIEVERIIVLILIIVMSFLCSIGKYMNMFWIVFLCLEKVCIFCICFFQEMELIGIKFIFIVVLMLVFMGGVIVFQMVFNMINLLFFVYMVGYIMQLSIILEFFLIIILLIFVGKIGLNVVFEIGIMCVIE